LILNFGLFPLNKASPLFSLLYSSSALVINWDLGNGPNSSSSIFPPKEKWERNERKEGFNNSYSVLNQCAIYNRNEKCREFPEWKTFCLLIIKEKIIKKIFRVKNPKIIPKLRIFVNFFKNFADLISLKSNSAFHFPKISKKGS